MKHPNPNQWMDWLYQELSHAERVEFESHLEACRECEAKAQVFKGTARALDRWHLPAKTSKEGSLLSFRPAILKWAAAALLLFSTGFAGARVGSVDTESLRESVAQSLRADMERVLQEKLQLQMVQAAEKAFAAAQQQYRVDFDSKLANLAEVSRTEAAAISQQHIQELSTQLSSLRDEDREKLIAALQEMEARRISDLRTLRQELETVAVMTEQSLRTAQRQLVQLAGLGRSNLDTP